MGLECAVRSLEDASMTAGVVAVRSAAMLILQVRGLEEVAPPVVVAIMVVMIDFWRPPTSLPEPYDTVCKVSLAKYPTV